MIPKFRVYETDRKAMHYTDENLVVCFSDNGVDVIDHTTFSSSCMAIDNFVLMKYTGLKDKNGVEIYEGDIVSCFNEGVSTVVFRYGTFGLLCNGYFEGFINVLGSFEVLGNTYDNGDLLK